MGALVFQVIPDAAATTAPLHTSFRDKELHISSHGDMLLGIHKETKSRFHSPGAFSLSIDKKLAKVAFCASAQDCFHSSEIAKRKCTEKGLHYLLHSFLPYYSFCSQNYGKAN